MNRVYIDELTRHTGEEVTLRGWVYNKRSSGKIKFVVMRDGTGLVQGVIVKGAVSEEVFSRFDELTQESSFEMTGRVRKEERAPGGYEMDLSGIRIISIARDYPITPSLSAGIRVGAQVVPNRVTSSAGGLSPSYGDLGATVDSGPIWSLPASLALRYRF